MLEVLTRQEARSRRASRSSASSSTPSPSRPSSTPCSIRARSTQPLVDAYLARRALDYLVGFTLSPVLWRKLPGARSAGRVQSVALRLVCDRELEIEEFMSRGILVDRRAAADHRAAMRFEARADRDRRQEAQAARHCQRRDRATPSRRPSKAASSRSRSVEKQGRQAQSRRRPSPPRPCSRKPRASSASRAKQTMQVAQRLYEGVDIGGETVGLITYMRTDGVQIVPEAVSRDPPSRRADYSASATCRRSPRDYKTKAKNAQEAHEAIRPTDFTRTPGRGPRATSIPIRRALRADLEAHRRQPDGVGRARADDSRDRRRRAATARPTGCAPPAR